MSKKIIYLDDAIDALKEHRALYCDNTPNTFSKLSYAEKSRVDELDTAIATLVNLPSAQHAQPEIIRCKDCKHYQFADNRAFGMPVKMCEWFGFEDVDDDDFCSRAERRTDG